jgi:DNA-binding response OmpR family regulator
MRRIIMVDDDSATVRVLCHVLEDAGYEAVAVVRGSDALAEVARREPAVVILDIGLPDMTGFEVAKELRSRRYVGPLMFLSGRDEIEDKLESFHIGAEDYIVKPVEPLELVARVRAVIRRFDRARRRGTTTVIRVDDAQLAVGDLTYSSDAVPYVTLTPMEARLLEYLMRNSRILISRATLLERIWDVREGPPTNRVNVSIRRLRRKIERDPTNPEYLHTVRGMGYVFRKVTTARSGADDSEHDDSEHEEVIG